MNYLTYDIIQSPDFEKYYRYLEFYSGNLESVELEQGHLYFFVIFISNVLIEGNLDFPSLGYSVNAGIYFGNSLIVLFGFFGLKKYLSNKFSMNNIYLVFTTICFIPPLFALRSTMKPEILVFGTIGWLLYFLDTYYFTRSKKYLMPFLVLFAFIVTSKISVAVMISIFLFLVIFSNYRDILDRNFLKSIPVLLLILIPISAENYLLNGIFITEVNHIENYDNTADIDFFTSINYKDLRNNPNRYFHNQSFVAITLFDTFNDFFKLYWNSEYTELNIDRKQIFNISKRLDNNPPLKINFDKDNFVITFSANFDTRWDDLNYIDETRMRGAFKLSVIYYLFILLSLFFRFKYKVLVTSPLIGILVISASSYGLFGTNNFDPLVGDSVKTFYYCFFIILSLLITLLKIYELGILKKSISLLLIILFLFFIGFPFSYSADTVEIISYKHSLLPFCKLSTPPVDFLLGMTSVNNCNFEEGYISAPLVTEARTLYSYSYSNNIPFVHIFIVLLYIINYFYNHIEFKIPKRKG